MDKRYECNIGALTEAEQVLINSKKAVIAGSGGLGCYIAEFLARVGIGHLTVIDGDVFTTSNLNRQLNSLEENLGKNKAAEAKNRLNLVNSALSVTAIEDFLSEKNAKELLNGHDVIIDALDNVKTRLLIEKTANILGIPLIHGAVEQWSAQICTVFPGDFTLSMLYNTENEKKSHDTAQPPLSVLSFTPAFCASIQASEVIKVLLNRENLLRKKFLTVDLRDNRFDTIELE